MSNRYHTACFAGSAETLTGCPPAMAEVAFAGRSNAGKSSALNALCNSRKLARTGRTPGRTQLINHFELGDGRYLVDLPGYGYAAVSRARQQAWQRELTRYISERTCLAGLVVVMDIRHPMTRTDEMLIDMQQQGGAGLHVLLTKADKLSGNARQRTLTNVVRELESMGVEATLQTFSALRRQGVEDLQSVLDHWLFGHALDHK